MARVVGLSPLFLRRFAAIGVRRGSPEAAAAGATIAALAEARELPGVLDTAAAMPPTARALVRRVAGRNLWLWYQATDDEIVLVTATRTPPVPIE